MGFSISFIAVKGREKAEVVGELGLADTGRPDPRTRARFVYAELPDGWRLVYSNSFDYASPRRIADLSKGALAVGCAVEEHVMFSGARAYEDGRELWSVIHDRQDGLYDLSMTGKPPAELQAIKDRLFKEQDEEGGADAGVDCIFDIPVELAAAVTGFRHDEPMPGSGGPSLTALKPLRPSFRQSVAALFGRR